MYKAGEMYTAIYTKLLRVTASAGSVSFVSDETWLGL